MSQLLMESECNAKNGLKHLTLAQDAFDVCFSHIPSKALCIPIFERSNSRAIYPNQLSPAAVCVSLSTKKGPSRTLVVSIKSWGGEDGVQGLYTWLSKVS